jgi:hypothetical protein
VPALSFDNVEVFKTKAPPKALQFSIVGANLRIPAVLHRANRRLRQHAASSIQYLQRVKRKKLTHL